MSEAEGDQCHAASGAHLRELLRGNHRYVFTLTCDNRLETVAQDVVRHFLGRGFVGKAMTGQELLVYRRTTAKTRATKTAPMRHSHAHRHPLPTSTKQGGALHDQLRPEFP